MNKNNSNNNFTVKRPAMSVVASAVMLSIMPIDSWAICVQR